MKKIHGYVLPNYSPEISDNTLFHYTSAAGLIGIITGNKLWCTATYCSNDESEMAAGEEIVERIFSKVIQRLNVEKDPIINTFYSRGIINIYEYAKNYRELLINYIFSQFKPYIACFCQAETKEVFEHGLLSQWRGYGLDGGYAIQINKEKLNNYINSASVAYEFDSVHYDTDNPLKKKMHEYETDFHVVFENFLRELAGEVLLQQRTMKIMSGMTAGALESLIKYLLYTKNSHFSEEREVRLSVLDADKKNTKYFNRGGLIVPYRETSGLDILDCVEAIIVGPSPRIEARYESVSQLLQTTGRKISVRPSQIPFSRN